MQDYMYSIIGIIAGIIHIIINPGLFRKNRTGSFTSPSYRFLMIAIFAYYITDALWGLFAGLNNIPVLFLDTTVYFVAMAAAVLCWTEYVIFYLKPRSFYGKALRTVGRVFFTLEIIALAVNFFKPCFFWFDENDAYQTGLLRNIALWTQVGLFFVTVLLTGAKTLRSSGAARRRYRAVCSFSIVMVLGICLQVFLPLLPVYAMACLIGCCILHVYVVEDEREEYRNIIAEEKNSAERANMAKTTFLFNMSHDIRMPMNAIIGFTGMAKKHVGETEQVTDYLDKIDLAGNQLLKLINQVLEMARIESGKVELSEHPLDMLEKHDVFQTIYGELAAAKDVKFTVIPAEVEHRYVIIDEDHMDQIVNNVISNAIKYTPAGGSVTYTTVEKPCDKEGMALIEITVKDTGIGMSPEYLEHVFEEFSRENTSTVSRIQGTGLGMSIVKNVSELMGGEVKIESEKNKGTTVTILMPMKIDPEPETAARRTEKQESFDISGLKVLLVEDNEMNREIASEILEERGITVFTAEDGDIAVEKMRAARPGDYDLILMDIQMPRMNGFEAAKAIRALPDEALASVPIIAMTANAFEEDKQNALAAGMNDHLSKPVDVDKLVKTLAKFRA